MNQEDSSCPGIIGHNSAMFRMLTMNPLQLAVVNGYIDEVKKCIETFDINHWNINNPLDNEGNTYLMIAAKNGYFDVIQYLVSRGADIHSTDREKVTVLMKAIDCGKLEIVKYFVSKGVNINATDENDETALMKSVELGHFDIVKYLISESDNSNININIMVTNK